MLRELYADPADLGPLEAPPRVEDEIQARRIMIAIEKTSAEAKRVKMTRDAVVAAYDQQTETLERRVAQLRSSLQGYVEQHGKARFPDVGTAYLTARDPKIEIDDKTVAEARYGPMFTKPVFDMTDFKAWALEEFHRTGEIPAGCKFVPGGPTLTIRRR